ncbi:macro domain-containing protein [Paenibacillus sp. HWE-109]|uniref:macro domain-containing protein n=1 Tax=Paenibacillus sp. HWE-109 TaxID=1306526 RepID=UPI001EE0A327|nr:macro domain-containing protein [Paenibacillus sp. HWE-109]UKS30853.1 macro domain-containing protein [Paenibacillus sp. HWE-109]
MSIQVIEGDLLSAAENIIAHQVNCRAKMASGVAKVIRAKYPNAYLQYMELFKNHRSESLLGRCQPVVIGENKYVANLFGQLNYGYGGEKYTNETALKMALISLKAFAVDNSLSVALPYKIGSDRGGADWNEVYKIIDEVFADYEVTLYRL